MWNMYDIYKLIYMLTSATPWPFKLNGIVQLMVDTGILAQIFYYGDRPRRPDFAAPLRLVAAQAQELR